jgi:hypothetical protein
MMKIKVKCKALEKYKYHNKRMIGADSIERTIVFHRADLGREIYVLINPDNININTGSYHRYTVKDIENSLEMGVWKLL